MPLTDAAIRNAKPAAKAVRLFDGGGLYLELSPAGGRWWRWKFRFEGKEKRLSLGTYPATPLRLARERRDEARALLAAGRDPSAERRAAKDAQQQAQARTFRAVAEAWMQHQAGEWGETTRAMVRATLEANAFPQLGATPVEAIKARDVARVVRDVEARGAGEAATRLLQRIRAVFRFAVVHDLLESNPVADLRPGELLKPRRVVHRAALPEAELPDFLARLGAYDGELVTALALRLLLLTVVRPGELRGARWAEIDLEARRWRVPAERMKMGAEHLVPLSSQAVEVLRQAEALRDGSGLVFPSPYYPGKPISENTLNSALARMGYKGIATAHGFRALFSTVANELGHDADVIERHLAHVERNEVRAAYHRAAYVAERAALVQWWADYLDGRQAGVVVPLRSPARLRMAER